MLFATSATILLTSGALGSQVWRHGASPIKCPVVFDGQVSASTRLADFDSANTSIYNPDYVKGNNLSWSQILKFPNVPNSKFDNLSYKPVEVTISDQSIFQSQNGFRRAGLLMNGDTNTGSPGTQGIKTLHFSVKQDPRRPLNLSHEYLNVWHETSDYSANQFNFEMGTIIGSSGSDKNTFKVLDRRNTQVWSTPIDPSEWQNFAVILDFDNNTLQIYYSKGTDALKSATPALPNDNSGGGQYQIGMLKKPTGTSDVVNSGYQEAGINEGQIYGGLFLEDGANGCLST